MIIPHLQVASFFLFVLCNFVQDSCLRRCHWKLNAKYQAIVTLVKAMCYLKYTWNYCSQCGRDEYVKEQVASFCNQSECHTWDLHPHYWERKSLRPWYRCSSCRHDNHLHTPRWPESVANFRAVCRSTHKSDNGSLPNLHLVTNFDRGILRLNTLHALRSRNQQVDLTAHVNMSGETLVWDERFPELESDEPRFSPFHLLDEPYEPSLRLSRSSCSFSSLDERQAAPRLPQRLPRRRAHLRR